MCTTRPSTSIDVGIIGGGPGGLATALALKRAMPGIKLKVFEQSVREKMQGAGLRLSHDGLGALKAIDPAVYQTVMANSYGYPKARILNPAGAVVRETNMAGTCAALTGWRELVDSLMFHLPEEEIAFETAYEHAEVHNNAVTVHFKDGSHRPVHAKLLIGCDGYSSGVAADCFPSLPPPVLETDTVAWRARTHYPHSIKGPSHNVTFIMGDGVIVTYLQVNESTKEVCWNVGITKELQDRLGVTLGQDAELRREMVLNILQGYPEEIRSLVAATDPRGIREGRLHVRDPEHLPSDKLGNNCVTLLGDSLHTMRPTAGQGGNSALEDAAVLGACVAQYGNTKKALRHYEAQRLPRVKAIATETRAVGRKVWQDGAKVLHASNDINSWESFPFLHYAVTPIDLLDIKALADADKSIDDSFQQGNILSHVMKIPFGRRDELLRRVAA